jgi:hypothetical protein
VTKAVVSDIVQLMRSSETSIASTLKSYFANRESAGRADHAYATRYVAFVDILGFLGIVNKSGDSEQMVEELANVLTSMGERNTELERTLG